MRAQNFKYIFYDEGGGGGGQKNDMAGYKILSIFWGEGKTKLDSFFFGGGGVFSMQQNGDSLRNAKMSFLFIYLFLN